MKRVLVYIYWNVLTKVFLIFPVKEKVFLESFLGRSYSDNPRAIFEYLRENEKDLKYIWSLTHIKDIKGATSVKKMSLRYLYELSTSKYIVSNSRVPLGWKKRADQKYIQTWHGTPLKRLVYDMEKVTLPDTDKEQYFKNFSKDVSRWDYLISPNKYSTIHLRSAFKYEGKVIEGGYPRNESLFNHDTKEEASIKKKLGIAKDVKIILYAPTFRDNKFEAKGSYIQEINFRVKEVAKSLGEDVVVLLRAHYLVKTINYKYESEGFLDVSRHDDINDLYKISDLLITDYSSVFFDYMILNKPILFYQYDQIEYKEDIRGFYIPLDELPGKVITKEEELYTSIEDIFKVDEVDYSEFYQKYDVHEEIGSTKKIVDEVL